MTINRCDFLTDVTLILFLTDIAVITSALYWFAVAASVLVHSPSAAACVAPAAVACCLSVDALIAEQIVCLVLVLIVLFCLGSLSKWSRALQVSHPLCASLSRRS